MKIKQALFFLFLSVLMAQEKLESLIKIQIRFLQIDKDLHQLVPNSSLATTKLQLLDVRDLFQLADSEFSEANFLGWLQKEIPTLVVGDEKDKKYSCSLLKGTLILKQSETVLKEVEQLLTNTRRKLLEFAPPEEIHRSEDKNSSEESLVFPSKEQWTENRKKIWEEILKKEGKPVPVKTFSKKLKADFTRFMQTEKPLVINAPSVIVFEDQKFEVSILRQISYVSDVDIKLAQDLTTAKPILDILNLGWMVSGKIASATESQFHLSEFKANYCEAKEPFNKIQTGVGVIIEVPETVTREISLEQNFFSEEILIAGPIRPSYSDSLEPIWIVIEAESYQEDPK